MLLRQTGVSMIQGLVVSSVLAGSALIATRMVQDQKKLLKATESRDQIEQLHRMVFTVLQNREHCKATLVTAGISTATVNQSVNIDAIHSRITDGGTSTETFGVNTGSSWNPNRIYMNNSVMINSMRFMTPSTTDPDPAKRVITYPSTLRIEYARLEDKDPNKRTKSGYGPKRIMKDVPIIIQRNVTTSAIDGCYAVQLGETVNGVTNEGNNNINQEFCSKLGVNGSLYVWDSAANKCVLKNNLCQDKYVFAGINSAGNAICNPLTDYMTHMVDTSAAVNCPSGASVTLGTGPDGRVRIICGAGIPAPPTNCAAATVSWVQGASTCTANVGTGLGPVSVSDSTAPTTGSGTATCSSGSWSATGTCTTSSGIACTSGIHSWSSPPANSCTTFTDAAPHGTVRTYSSFSNRNPGTATLICNNGNWDVQSQSCLCHPSGANFGSGCSASPGGSECCSGTASAVDAGYNCSPPNESQRYYNWYCN